jgi:tetratricopeptide (TPR) repeat protein
VRWSLALVIVLVASHAHAQDAAAHVALGREHMARGEYDEAASEARLGGDDTDATTLLGEALIARGHLDDAEAALRGISDRAEAHRARVMLGRLLVRRSRMTEARPILMRLVRAYNDHTITRTDAAGLSYVGMATAMLGSPHDANDAFTASARADRTRVETQLEWAQLFLDHDDAGHAEECVNDALAASPHDAMAHVLRARILLEQSWDFGAARDELDAALAVNPSLVAAHVTLAGIAIRDEDWVTADRRLDEALAIDRADLEALSMRAALRFVSSTTHAFESAVDAVLRESPSYTRVFTLVAEHADWAHRYDEIIALARRALAIDPHDARAQADLAINLLRRGDETEGLSALRTAFAEDHFDVRAYNLLHLFDGPIAHDYETFDAAPFVFRMHHDERAVLERYVPRLLSAAYADMRRRYHFTPSGPIHIELFATQQHFAVRTSGLPSLGAQGVCFGRVVTALSPRAGPFDWAEITTHELSHVFHIQMSHGRVPRWFTEGLAEHETTLARPEWRREDDYRLYRALANGSFPPIRDLSFAFTHARSPDAMLTAYFGSWRVVAYLDSRFGFAALPRMLREWGRGRSTAEVFHRVLHAEVDDVDRDFRASELARLARFSTDFAIDASEDLEHVRSAAHADATSATAQSALAAAEMTHGHAVEALAAARAAIAIAHDDPTARFVLAVLAAARHDATEAETQIASLRGSGHDGYEVEMIAAQVAHDDVTRRSAIERAIAIDDTRIEAHHALFDLFGTTSDAAGQLREARRLVDLDEHDRDSLAFVLDALDVAGDTAGLDAIIERTLTTDPERARGHELCAASYERRGRHADALYEADTWLLLAPDRAVEIQTMRARLLHALHRERDARAAEALAQPTAQ